MTYTCQFEVHYTSLDTETLTHFCADLNEVTRNYVIQRA